MDTPPNDPVADSPRSGNALTRRLAGAPAPAFVAYAIAAAFGVYFCMYAFRKPYLSVSLPGYKFLGSGIELKTACVIGQILGYMISKYLGSRFCSEIRSSLRAVALIGLILIAQLGLVLFAVVPPMWMPAAMLLNGLPLGMVWGLVVRYLEGRRFTELLLAGLSCSFIIAGAATRDVGNNLVINTWGVDQLWMPAVTGAVFFVPLLATVWMLDQLPPPSAADVAQRAPRQTMDRRQRLAFLAYFGLGLALLLFVYFFLTAYREVREVYGSELFKALDLADRTAIFSRTEQWAMFAAIAAMGSLNLIANHRAALWATYAVVISGFAAIGIATYLFRSGDLSGFAWMAWIGVGLYLAYVPYGAILFERMMAASRFPGTSVFAIQLADGIGYSGSVLVQLYRDLAHGDHDHLSFFIPFSYTVSLIGVVLMSASAVAVLRRVRTPAPASGWKA